MKLRQSLTLLEDDSQVTDWLAKIPKTNKKTLSAYSEAVYHLALGLYLTDQTEAAKRILEILAQTEFENDYDKWTFVNAGLVLLAYIDRDQPEQVQALRALILAPLELGTDFQVKIKQRVWQRRLTGYRLEERRAEIAASEEDSWRQDFYRRLLMGELIWLYLFQNETGFSEEELLQQIRQEEQLLKDRLAEHPIDQEYPFKTTR